MMATHKPVGYQGYVKYYPTLADGDVIDCSEATFTVDKDSTDDGKSTEAAIWIRSATDVECFGGKVLGQVNQEMDRAVLYKKPPGNQSTVYMRDVPRVHLHHWRLDKVWDGPRCSENCDGFLIEHLWITDARDDAIENDKLNSGTYRDILMDGCWGGISCDPGTGGDPALGIGKTIVFDGVLFRGKRYLNEGRVVHYTPLKFSSTVVVENVEVRNCVFAVDQVTGNDNYWDRLERAWQRITVSENNVFLNLSDDAFAADFPMPPADWTVLSGQAARDYWQRVRDEWVMRHANLAIEGDHVPQPAPEPEPEPQPEPEPLETRVAALEARVAALETGSLTERIEAVEAAVASQAARLSALEAATARIEALEAEVARLDGRLDAIASGAAD